MPRISDLKGREVINIADGRSLGRIMDLEFDTSTGKIHAFMVPGRRMSWFRSVLPGDDVVIGWDQIQKIGEHVILVNIDGLVPSQKRRWL